jgi:prepilin signal peptidase PulO-like enzyme (type II secretory pathway)
MKMYKCPVCNEKTISILKKANLNVNYYSRCKKCNAKYGPPYIYSALLTLVVCIGYYFSITLNIHLILKTLLAIFSFSLSVYINIVFMPIIKK